MSESKDVIYIDVDDEITSIIDKVRSSNKKIAALVLPKRASVLQSIVNMKLLKRTANQADKKLVLITSEAGLLPLAGSVGLHVAKTLQTKPEIPGAPDIPKDSEDLIEEDASEAVTEPELDPKKSVGELAGATALSGVKPPDETIDLDNTTSEPTSPDKKPKKAKKPKVPNFDSFRKKLFLGLGALILLIILWFLAFSILPKANITISTVTSNMNATPAITVDTAAKAVDTSTSTIPGETKQDKKTETQTGTATGQKDVGTKATGTISISNCSDSDPSSYPAGTQFSSSSGKGFSADQSFTISGAKLHGGSCSPGSGSVNVTAVANGDSYNLGATSYTSSAISSQYTITGTTMSGGSTKIATVITQQDFDTAKSKLPDDKDIANSELTKAIQADTFYVLAGTLSAGTPSVTSSPNVGDQATSFTVTSSTTYTMLGVKQDDLKKLIDQSLTTQIDINKQQVQDYGLDKAAFAVTGSKSNVQFQVSVQTTVAIGPKINVDDLKKQIAGKKGGDIHDSIASQPGVKDVTVKFSPFWVSSAPKKTGKITVALQKSQ